MPVPTALSPESSSLSSVPTQLTAHEKMEGDVGARLASYQSTDTNDYVVIILKSFVKCVITKLYDTIEAANLSPGELQRTATAETEAAHIIPFSLGHFSETERWNTATVWDAMYRSRVNLSADTINDTHNAMTMMAGLHPAPGKFWLALEPTGNKNGYRLKRYRHFPSMFNVYIPPDGLVTLTTNYLYYHLPSASLLEAHAAIAQILHMTGMGKYIENILRERQLIRCLAPDGTTNVTSLLMVF